MLGLVGGSAESATIAHLEVFSAAPFADPKDAWSLLDLREGEAFTLKAAQSSLRNLFATGVVSEAEIRTTEEEDGLKVQVVVWGQALVEKVQVKGRLGLTKSRLQSLVLVYPGSALRSDRVIRSLWNMEDALKADGYREARVSPEVELNETGRSASVTFLVDAGARARVGKVQFEGILGPYEAQDLRRWSKLEEGKPAQDSRIHRAAEMLVASYVEKGYRLARISLEGSDFAKETNRVDLRFAVRTGPLVEVSVEGGSLKKLRRKGAIPLLGSEGYDEALVLASVEGIRDWYQKKGHHRVRVDVREKTSPGKLEVIFKVDPGPVHRMDEIVLGGTHQESLPDLMETRVRRIGLGKNNLVDSVLQADIENLRRWYSLEGWSRVAIGPPEVEYSSETLKVSVPIEEGPRQVLKSLVIQGVEEESLLRSRLTLREGEAFHPRHLSKALGTAEAFLQERGYTEPQILTLEEWNESRTEVDLTLRVQPGPLSTVDRLIVRGVLKTDPSLVRNATGLKSGESFNRSRLGRAERALYRLGVFSFVDVTAAPGPDDSGERDVLIEVKEGRTRRLTYGLGYDTEDGIGGLLGFSHQNLFGRAQRLQLDLRYSRRSELYRLIYTRPFFGGRRPWEWNARFFRDRETRDSFEVRRLGGSLETSYRTDHFRFGLALEFRDVDLTVVEVLDERLERDQTDVEILSWIPRLTWDHRDAPLDPRRGWLTSIQMEWAEPFLGTEQDFLKAFLDQKAYTPLPLGWLAFSGRIGAIENRGDVPVAISERFFGGGRNSHRAFKRDSLGINGETLDEDGDPLGGKGLILFNLDWRFPLVGPLGGTLFWDAGNVWEDWDDANLGELRHGYGVGLRYLSPIGPLRLEVGWKLDPLPGESAQEFFLSFGNTF